MSQKNKETRTQIADLPEIAVELSQKELRIVSGGLRPIFACNSRLAAPGNVTMATDWNTNGDHDPD